ncbi:hypothetical protein CRUP_032659, partial [Coryphaenoides rupestris]
MEEEEVTVGPEGSGMGLALSQSQVLSPEPMEEEREEGEGEGRQDEDVSNGLLKLSERSSQVSQQAKTAHSQPACGKVSTNGHQLHSQSTDSQVTPDRLSLKGRAGPEADGPKEKSFSDSSGEIPFNFTLPKECDLIGPAVVATPPLVNQLKQTPRHSTPIEINSFSEKPPAVGDVSVVTSDIVADDSGEEGPEKEEEEEEGKLSLRMKLVTPVEDGSSGRFSLQKPSLSDEEGSVVKVTTVAKAVTSPSVFSRVRQVHRQVGAEEEAHYTNTTTSTTTTTNIPTRPGATPRTDNAAARIPSSKRTISQQTSVDGPGLRTPTSRLDAETPPFQRATGPAHRRHVRTTQEVRTTVTRIITDVYYEDGKEVERKVTEESEEPVVDFQVLDISPSRTASSMTSGDLGDLSSLSSKLSGGSTAGCFIMPPSRGGRASRGAAASAIQRLGGAGAGLRPAAGFVLEEEPPPMARVRPPRLPDSPPAARLPSPSDSLRTSPSDQEQEEGGISAGGGSSFVGLRVVAKWSSNGYFYSGRITRDLGEGRFGLRFDDGYECEVAGGDVLLCDPRPRGDGGHGAAGGR